MTQQEMDSVEDVLIATLTNEPSEPVLVETFGVVLIFQRPSLVGKFQGRAWSTKKLKEVGITEEDDPNLSFFFRYWGTLNAYVKQLLVQDKSGDFKFKGKTYSDYTFDPAKDLGYKSLFEKYVMEEIYEKGISEESFISEVVVLHADWINSMAQNVKEDDLKNS